MVQWWSGGVVEWWSVSESYCQDGGVGAGGASWARSSEKTNSNSHFNLEMLQINLPSAVYIVGGTGE